MSHTGGCHRTIKLGTDSDGKIRRKRSSLELSAGEDSAQICAKRSQKPRKCGSHVVAGNANRETHYREPLFPSTSWREEIALQQSDHNERAMRLGLPISAETGKPFRSEREVKLRTGDACCHLCHCLLRSAATGLCILDCSSKERSSFFV